MTKDDAVPVTQADRLAAGPFANCLSDMQDIFDGKADGLPVVQAFARHRGSTAVVEELPRLDAGLIEAAMIAHYGKSSAGAGIDGLDLTVNDHNWSFREGFTRMWAGVRKELKRRASLSQTPATPMDELQRLGQEYDGAAVREAGEHYSVAMERRPKEIGGVKVGPGLYRIHWKDGGSSLAAIGMCRNGAWWVAPTNWVEPAVPFRIDEDPEGRWSWNGVKALDHLDPATPMVQEGLREALAEAYRKGATDVHNYWVKNPGEPPQGDPEFGEAASDYASAALDILALSATPAPPVDETDRPSALDKRTFLTCVSGDGPTPYLKVHFNNLADAHAAHDELLGVKKETEYER